MTSRNVLVTGGAGYVGAHACKALAKAGFAPFVYDNLSTGHESFVRWGPLIKADIRDHATLREAMLAYDISAVLHFAACAYVGESVINPHKYYDNNVTGTLALLRAMLDTDTSTIVFSSSCAIYGPGINAPTPKEAPTGSRGYFLPSRDRYSVSLMTVAYDLTGKRVWVAGHSGMVGSALVRRLQKVNCTLLTVSHRDLDLTRQREVEAWVAEQRPQTVFLAAAKVGGIVANDSAPVDFLYDNLAIATNVIHAAAAAKVEKLLFLGSSCVYPKLAPQPIKEEALLTGPLEPTNQWYAIAKIAGLKTCQAYRRQQGWDFISSMPTNLYGPGDNFDLTTSHVIPALIRKAHEAKIRNEAHLMIWGSGNPRREFLHVDDAADALVHLMTNYSGESHINIGCGTDITISELASRIAGVVGFQGNLATDPSKPDGTPRKLLDIGKLTDLGWKPKIALEEGIASTYRWFLENVVSEKSNHSPAPQLMPERLT